MKIKIIYQYLANNGFQLIMCSSFGRLKKSEAMQIIANNYGKINKLDKQKEILVNSE